MNQKSLSVQNKTHKQILSFLKNQKISKVYSEFSSSLNSGENLAVAVSGGPDSLALAYLTKCYSIKNKVPFLMVSKSGGARMMEASLSLMQLVKTSAKLAQLAEAKIPYISLCTDPTTGGTTASFAMLGDINIAEPNALIAFAGPRVVKDTTGKDLPKGFQRSEFVLEHGFLDGIYERKNLKKQVNLYIDLIQNIPVRNQ